jgi:hypothetical protein
MPGRPNIQKAELNGTGDKLTVLGQTDKDPLPQEIQIFLEHDGVITRGGLTAGAGQMVAAWAIEMDGHGFSRGDEANGVGVEIRTNRFEASSWTQTIVIE